MFIPPPAQTLSLPPLLVCPITPNDRIIFLNERAIRSNGINDFEKLSSELLFYKSHILERKSHIGER